MERGGIKEKDAAMERQREEGGRGTEREAGTDRQGEKVRERGKTMKTGC